MRLWNATAFWWRLRACGTRGRRLEYVCILLQMFGYVIVLFCLKSYKMLQSFVQLGFWDDMIMVPKRIFFRNWSNSANMHQNNNLHETSMKFTNIYILNKYIYVFIYLLVAIYIFFLLCISQIYLFFWIFFLEPRSVRSIAPTGLSGWGEGLTQRGSRQSDLQGVGLGSSVQSTGGVGWSRRREAILDFLHIVKSKW